MKKTWASHNCGDEYLSVESVDLGNEIEGYIEISSIWVGYESFWHRLKQAWNIIRKKPAPRISMEVSADMAEEIACGLLQVASEIGYERSGGSASLTD